MLIAPILALSVTELSATRLKGRIANGGGAGSGAGVMGHSGAVGHSHGRSGAVTPDGVAPQATRAACRRRCTSRIDTAAGVTPGTRAAWPSVAGRTAASCWRTSFDSPASDA